MVEYLEDGSPIGYVRIPKIREDDTEPTSDDGRLHIIFSSGCNYFQHWQSELLLATAHLVGQRGRITRIVSGCNEKSAETVKHKHQTFPGGKNDLLVPLNELNRSVNENFGLFITPAFEGAIHFPWINKPSSIQYFMEKARPELDRLGETIVAILDPDFVFLKPLTQTGGDDYIATQGHDKLPGVNDPVDVAMLGRPVAQRYGIGGGWVNRAKFNLSNITGEANPAAASWSYNDAARWTSVGPPMILHVDDITKLSSLWAKYMRPVLDVKAEILADMWAYSIAAAQLDLKHTTLDHYMISSIGTTGEAYPWVDAYKSLSCHDPRPQPGDRTPTFVHMASGFRAPHKGDDAWMFHKGHVPAKIFDCDTPLIVEAPDNTWEISPDTPTKQRAWVLCHIVSRFDRVLLLYKQKFCPEGSEQRKLVRLVPRKRKDRRCKEHEDKWCFPLAQIEGLPDDWRHQAD